MTNAPSHGLQYTTSAKSILPLITRRTALPPGIRRCETMQAPFLEMFFITTKNFSALGANSHNSPDGVGGAQRGSVRRSTERLPAPVLRKRFSTTRLLWAPIL